MEPQQTGEDYHFTFGTMSSRAWLIGSLSRVGLLQSCWHFGMSCRACDDILYSYQWLLHLHWAWNGSRQPAIGVLSLSSKPVRLVGRASSITYWSTYCVGRLLFSSPPLRGCSGYVANLVSDQYRVTDPASSVESPPNRKLLIDQQQRELLTKT